MTDTTQIESHSKDQHAEYFNLSHGNKSAFISFNNSGRVNVLCKNASHEAYSGSGRFFDSAQDALDGYKSEPMRKMIRAALSEYAQIKK